MNFLLKILDCMDTERVSAYSAWLIDSLMNNYTKKQKAHMWSTLYAYIGDAETKL